MTRLLVPVPVRWADMDAYGHVNNVAMLRLLEEARIAAFWRHPEASDAPSWPTAVLDAGPGAATHTLVARTEIEYLLPLSYRRQPVTVEMWLGRIGGASLDVCYEVTSGGPGERTPGPRSTGATVATDDDGDHDGLGHDGDPGPASGHLPGRRVYARAATTLVLVDAGTGRPRRVTPGEREVWSRYVEDPVPMRRRGG